MSYTQYPHFENKGILLFNVLEMYFCLSPGCSPEYDKLWLGDRTCWLRVMYHCPKNTRGFISLSNLMWYMAYILMLVLKSKFIANHLLSAGKLRSAQGEAIRSCWWYLCLFVQIVKGSITLLDLLLRYYFHFLNSILMTRYFSNFLPQKCCSWTLVF